MDKKPIPFSVIIATYQREKLLIECVRHILLGNYQDFEILIIDQNPARTLGSLLESEFPGEIRLRYFALETPGVSNARNVGLNHACGEYVAFIDDDAEADENWLSAFAELFLEGEISPALIAGRIKPFWTFPKPRWYPDNKTVYLGLYDIGDEVCLLPNNDQPISANLAGRRADLLLLGGFDTKMGSNALKKIPHITGEDTMLGLHARQAGLKIYYQPKAIVFHQISGNKLSRSFFLKRLFWEGITVIFEIMLSGNLEKRGPHFKYHIKRIFLCAGRFCFPRFKNNNNNSKPVEMIRMDALGNAAFSLGVIYGLFNPIQ